MSEPLRLMDAHRFNALCVKCGHTVSAKRVATVQDALVDHVAYAHPDVTVTFEGNPVDEPKGMH